MRLLTIAATSAALALAACSQPAEPTAPAETPIAITAPSGEYAIDQTHATVNVSVKHFGPRSTPSGLTAFRAR
ncbi:MAG: hypothetical protein NVV62_18910 [Terricaulis sp.]|nr:hypothetical protein [Terricaulis sp.]